MGSIYSNVGTVIKYAKGYWEKFKVQKPFLTKEAKRGEFLINY